MSAWLTLLSAYAFVVRPDYSHYSEQLLLGISGLVSPLAVISLSLSGWTKGKSVRIVIAAVTCLLLIVANITIFWSGHLLQERVIPLAGHYLWTAGILALLVPEFLKPNSFSS